MVVEVKVEVVKVLRPLATMSVPREPPRPSAHSEAPGVRKHPQCDTAGAPPRRCFCRLSRGRPVYSWLVFSHLARRISSSFVSVLSGLDASCLGLYSQILTPGSKVSTLEGCQLSCCRNVGVTQSNFRTFLDKSICFEKEFCQIFLSLLLLAGLNKSV